MATSGSTDFSLTRDELIKSAYRLIGVGLDGNALGAEEVTNASNTLNMMLKAMQSDGLQLWAQKKATLFLQDGVNTYNLGPSGHHATSTYTSTTVKVAAAASATTIDVTSTTGMAASDNIGFVLDDNTMHWTTISSVTDSDTVVIASGLASASAVGKKVVFYTTKIHRPLRITTAVRRTTTSNDTPLERTARADYWNLGKKTTEGPPNQFYFDPQLTNSVLYVYPTPGDSLETIEFVYHRPFEDFDSMNDTPDFPQEWYEAIRYGLAVRLSNEYGVPLDKKNSLKEEANEYKMRAMYFDREDGSVFFRPERYG